MKKTAIILSLTAAILSALLCACASKNSSVSAAVTMEAGTSPSAISAAVSETMPQETLTPTLPIAASAFVFEEAAYVSGSIAIRYPQLVGLTDAGKQAALNQLIADTALRDSDLIENDSAVTSYEITNKVTYNTPEIISMYFSGYSDYENAAHPSQFMYTVTIDVQQLKIVTLPELIRIDEDSVGLLIDGVYSAVNYDMTPEYAASIKEYLKGMAVEPEFFINELKNADTLGNYTSSYLTKDGLVVSVSVPHVMGDHIEILLKYGKLKDYQTDNPLWAIIEK